MNKCTQQEKEHKMSQLLSKLRKSTLKGLEPEARKSGATYTMMTHLMSVTLTLINLDSTTKRIHLYSCNKYFPPNAHLSSLTFSGSLSLVGVGLVAKVLSGDNMSSLKGLSPLKNVVHTL